MSNLSDLNLWLPKTFYENMIRENMMAPAPFIVNTAVVPTKLETDISRLLYLIATGYSIDASILAKEIATKVYDENLDRRFCEETGNVYFHACDHDDCW